MRYLFVAVILLLVHCETAAQELKKGTITDYFLDLPVKGASITILNKPDSVITDSLGQFEIHLDTSDFILIQAKGFRKVKMKSPHNPQFRVNIISLKPPPESERFYSVVDEGAELPDKKSFYVYVLENFALWDRVKKDKISGRVDVEIQINEGGKLISSRITKGLSKYIDDEVLRVVNNAQQWKPAVLKGKTVKHKINFTVVF